MRRRNKNKRQIRIVIGTAICLLLIMTAGYAAFSTNITLTAKGNIKDLKASALLKKKVVTEGDGLYKDSYEENHYIYRGKNPDNYITFNNEKSGWRILSIENNGTLKIVRAQSIGTYIFDGSRTTGYCSSAEALANGCNAWMASENYVNGKFTGKVDKDAEVNIYLNNTYYETLSNEAKNQTVAGNFNVGSVTPRNQNLAEQITMEKTLTWEGKVGLMSASEYISGNLNVNNQNPGTCSTANYLINSFSNIPNTWALSLSPSFQIINSTIVFSSAGVISYDYPNSIGGASDDHNGIVPVLYLKADITLKGEGTEANPYTISWI